jgi:hypothetical protein
MGRAEISHEICPSATDFRQAITSVFCVFTAEAQAAGAMADCYGYLLLTLGLRMSTVPTAARLIPIRDKSP